MIIAMPSVHRVKKTFSARPKDTDFYERASEAVKTTGLTMNAWLLACIAWGLGDTDELPPRMIPASHDPSEHPPTTS